MGTIYFRFSVGVPTRSFRSCVLPVYRPRRAFALWRPFNIRIIMMEMINIPFAGKFVGSSVRAHSF